MAGSISLSLSQQFNSLGNPLAGGQLFFIQAGTTSTPQNAFQDSALTLPWANPMTLDAAGRVPQLYFADGFIKIRLTDRNGVVQVVADNILVVGPSSGSGAGPSVDPTTVLQTGWLVPIYGTGQVTGFVRANGRTIGSASSGASESANADTQALFIFLWTVDPNLAVSTGRGVSAAADWAANKQIALPDFRGRALAGLDDMGNAAAGRLTSSYFGATATVLGAAGGGESQTLTQAQLPAVSPTFSGTPNAFTVTAQAGYKTAYGSGPSFISGGGTGNGSWTNSPYNFSAIGQILSDGSITPAGTISALGSGNPHNNTQPTMLASIYIKK